MPGVADNDRAHMKPAQLLFAGRIGGNQEFIVDRHDPERAALLRKTPDAAPFMSIQEAFDLRGFQRYRSVETCDGGRYWYALLYVSY